MTTEMNSSARALRTLAFLESRVNHSGAADRLEVFMPLITESLRKFSGFTFVLNDIASEAHKDHGLKLPQNVIAVLLDRLCRRGHLQKNGDGSFRFGDKPIRYQEHTAEKQDFIEAQKTLLLSMKNYAASLDIIVTENEVANLLYEYIDTHFSDLTLRNISTMPVNEKAQYHWIHRYVLEMEQSSTPEFDTMIRLIQGVGVYDAAFFTGFAEEEPSLKNLHVFFDTPILCDALGMGSKEDKDLAIEAIQLIQDSGAICRVLEQTVQEAESILCAIRSSWNDISKMVMPGSYGDHLRKQGASASFVYELEQLFESKLETDLKLSIVPSAKREAAYTADEAELAKMLSQGKTASDSYRVRHDVDSVANVLTLRRGITAKTINSAKAIFVVKPGLTLKNTTTWWKTTEERTDICPMISITNLANYAWLSGSRKTTKCLLQRKLAVSTCVTSLQPTAHIWEEFVEQLKRLVNRDDLSLETAQTLIRSANFSSCLASFEESNTEISSEGDVRAILDQTRRSIVLEDTQKERIAVNERIRLLEKRAQSSDAKAECEKNRRASAERNAEMEKEVARQEQARSSRKQSEQMRLISNRVHTIFRVAYLALGAIGLGVLFALWTTGFFNLSQGISLSEILAVPCAIAAVGSIATSIRNSTSILEKKAIKWLTMPSDSDDIIFEPMA